jgi:predicted ATP-dependent protease
MPELHPDDLRWSCPSTALDFATTDDVAPVNGVVGQQTAKDALRFGLRISAPGQNIYVRGQDGTGRQTLVKALIEDVRDERGPRPDHVLVHDFSRPDRPVVLALAPGTAPAFAAALLDIETFAGHDLEAAIEGPAAQERIAWVRVAIQAEITALMDPFEAELAEAGLVLRAAQTADATRPILLPIIDGEPATPQVISQLQASGELSGEAIAELQARVLAHQPRMVAVTREVAALQRAAQVRTTQAMRAYVAELVSELTAPIAAAHPEPAVAEWLDKLAQHLARHGPAADEAARRRLRVNVIATRAPGEPAPAIVDNAPTAAGLLGSVDAIVLPDGTAVADHLTARPGTLLRADGGYLLLEAADLVTEPGTWRALIRTLRAGRVNWFTRESGGGPSLVPHSIPIDVKVVLLGPPGLYALLDANDPEFSELFKVLADFETVIDRDDDGVRMYAAVLARLAADCDLPPFDASAVGALVEHGARIAGQDRKLTARFGRLGDIAHEAAFVAREAEATIITAAHVNQTVRRTKARGALPAARFQESVTQGSKLVAVSGTVVGQINGLAVLHAGPLTYGFPVRISATLGPGTGGTVNIEGEADLSGSIHTKGFHILSGVLRTLLPTDHPLAFDASIAFEQSYGGIDGDSASGAEACCLLSALTRIPIRQDLAMTGAIDQHGRILPIGAVSEKIEGFHDVCRAVGFTGTQGVVIPRSNAGALMLRDDVVESARSGSFHIYVVDTIHEVLELFMGRPAGDVSAGYAEGTILGAAIDRAKHLWTNSQ